MWLGIVNWLYFESFINHKNGGRMYDDPSCRFPYFYGSNELLWFRPWLCECDRIPTIHGWFFNTGREIKLYCESSWISTPVVGGSSYNKSTHDGFHKYVFSIFPFPTIMRIISLKAYIPINRSISLATNKKEHLHNLHVFFTYSD